MRELPGQRFTDRFFVHRRGNGVKATQKHGSILLFKSFRNRVRDPRNRLHCALDLPRLYPLTMDFHHPVRAVYIEQIAVRKHSADVAGIDRHPAIRLWMKGFRGLLRQVVILIWKGSCRDNDAVFARGNLLPVLIKKTDRHISHGFPDRRILVFTVDEKNAVGAHALCHTKLIQRCEFGEIDFRNLLTRRKDQP